MPTAALRHLRGCPDCQEQVELHRALSGRVRAAEAERQSVSMGGRRRRRLSLAAAGVASVLVLASGIAFLVSRPDPVLAAAAASGLQPQFLSGDGRRIGAWCEQVSGRSMPELDLAPLAPVGARIDRNPGSGIVTVFYLTPDGRPVEVGWLDSSPVPATRRSVTTREVGGRMVLVTVSQHGTAVISGSAPDKVLWQAASQIQQGTSG